MNKPILIFLAAMLLFSGFSFAWWDNDWNTRRLINLTMLGTTNIENMTVNVTIDTTTNKGFQNDCDDIRFIAADNTTLINYTFENLSSTIFGCATTGTQLWINVSLIKSDNSSQIWLYWNNSLATTVADSRLADGTGSILHILPSEGNNLAWEDLSKTHKFVQGQEISFSNGIYGNSINCSTTDSWAYETTSGYGNIGSIGSNYTVTFFERWDACPDSACMLVQMSNMDVSNYQAPFRIYRYPDGSWLLDTISAGVESYLITNGTGFDTDNNWHFISITRRGPTLTIFLGNVSTQTFWVDKSGTITDADTNSNELRISFCSQTNNTANTFRGGIDELRVYDRVLSYD